MEKLRSGESVENNKNNKKRIIIVLAILLLVFLIIMLFCLFSSKTYEITFDSDGGTEIEPIKVKENEKVNKPINPLKEGYSFDGWYYLNELYDFNRSNTFA